MSDRLLIWFLPLALIVAAAQARELAVEESELISVELSSVAVEPFTGTPVALLREPDSGAIVPIFIGPAEAQAIMFALREVQMPRPMTHDLMASLLDTADATLESVIVDELRDGTYFGVLKLRFAGRDAPVLVDTRPSDGMALSARTRAPIFVSQAVLEAGADVPFEGLGPEEQVVSAMGITVVKVTPELRQALELPEDPGVLVSAVDGLTAARSGIRAGSLILEVNGMAPEDPMGFLEHVGETPAGEMATLKFWREGEESTVELPTTVPDRPAEERRRI